MRARAIVLPVLMSAALLAGCSATSDEASSAPVTSDTAGAEVTETPSAPATRTPSPTATATAERTPTNTTSGRVDTNVDLQDGIRTNDFGRLPDQILDMSLRSSQTDPGSHMATFEWGNSGSSARLLLRAYIPEVDGESTPVTDTSDQSYVVAIDSAVATFEEEGFTPAQFTIQGGGYPWDCVEVTGTQDGEVDHTLCATIAYGRIIEIQRLGVSLDEAERRQVLQDLVNEVGSAVAALAR